MNSNNFNNGYKANVDNIWIYEDKNPIKYNPLLPDMIFCFIFFHRNVNISFTILCTFFSFFFHLSVSKIHTLPLQFVLLDDSPGILTLFSTHPDCSAFDCNWSMMNHCFSELTEAWEKLIILLEWDWYEPDRGSI